MPRSVSQGSSGPTLDGMKPWTPDLETIAWGMAHLNERQIGEAIVDQLRTRAPEVSRLDPALLGEAAVECVLYRMYDQAGEAQ